MEFYSAVKAHKEFCADLANSNESSIIWRVRTLRQASKLYNVKPSAPYLTLGFRARGAHLVLFRL